MRHLSYLLFLGAAVASAQTAVWPGGVVSDAQLLVASNLCGSRLSASIPDTTSTTIFVVNATVNSTCFLVNEEVQVDNEFMQILSVGFGQLTVSRAFDHSTASTHQTNAPVNVTAAAWYHNQSRLEIESLESWLKSGGAGGLPQPIGPNGSCLTVTAGVAVWGSCSGSGNVGTVTSFSVTSVPAWLTSSVATATSTPALTLAAATGLTSHKVVGTCGTATTAALCSLVLGDLPTTVVNATSPGAGIAHFAGSTQTVTSSPVVLTSDVSGLLPIANGGTGTATPGLVAGTNVTITGSWPNQTINSSGGGGSGTVTVVGGGSLTNTAFMTGGGTTLAQTPSATSTLDTAGDAVFNGTVTVGSTLSATAGLFGSTPPLVGGTGLFAFTETSAPSGAGTGIDMCYGSSAQHGLLCAFNSSSFVPLTTGPASSTSGDLPTFNATNGGSLSDSGIAASSVLTAIPTQYKVWTCETGFGDGFNSIPAGTYLQSFCYNTSGVTVTLTGLKCYVDGGSSSTMNAAGNTLGALLTGAVTCTTGFAAGTQSTNVLLTSTDYIKFTFIADGTAKQATFVVTGTY